MDRDFIFPFGMLAAIMAVVILLFTLLLKHPLNVTGQVTVADYLFSMGLFSLFFVFMFQNFDNTSLDRADYQFPAFIITFLLAFGMLAFVKNVLFSTVDTSNLVPLTVAGLPTELYMLFVATVEELMFRVALPVFLAATVFRILPREAKWFGAVLVSSVLFGFWHYFAYAANNDLMLLAMVAGMVFSIAYRVGALMGAGDLAFTAIVAGHYFWNLTASGLPTAIPAVLVFLLLVTMFIMLVNPQANQVIMTYLVGMRRALSR